MINVDDYGASARLLAATTLRNVLGTKNLGDILSDREAIAQDMQVSSYIFEECRAGDLTEGHPGRGH